MVAGILLPALYWTLLQATLGKHTAQSGTKQDVTLLNGFHFGGREWLLCPVPQARVGETRLLRLTVQNLAGLNLKCGGVFTPPGSVLELTAD